MDTLTFSETKGSLFDRSITNPIEEVEKKVSRTSPTRRSSRKRELYNIENVDDVTERQKRLTQRISSLRDYTLTSPVSRESDEYFRREAESIQRETEILNEALDEIQEEMEEEEVSDLIQILDDIEEEEEEELEEMREEEELEEMREEEELEDFPVDVLSGMDSIQTLGLEDYFIVDFQTLENAMSKYPNAIIKYSFGDGQINIDDSIILVNKNMKVSYYNPNFVINRMGKWLSEMFRRRGMIKEMALTHFENYPMKTRSLEKDSEELEKLLRHRFFTDENGDNVIEQLIDLDNCARDFVINNCQVCGRRIGHFGCCLSKKCIHSFFNDEEFNQIMDVEFTTIKLLHSLYKAYVSSATGDEVEKLIPLPDFGIENLSSHLEKETTDIPLNVLWWMYARNSLFGEIKYISDGEFFYTKYDDISNNGKKVFITLPMSEAFTVMTDGFNGGNDFYSDINLSRSENAGEVTFECHLLTDAVNSVYLVENPDLLNIKKIYIH